MTDPRITLTPAAVKAAADEWARLTSGAEPAGNPALAAAVQAILDRRLAASHGIGDDTGRRAALLLEILPDAAAALEAAAPHLAAAERDATVDAMYAGAAKAIENAVTAERERCARLAEQHGAVILDSGTWAHGKPFAALLRDQP